MSYLVEVDAHDCDKKQLNRMQVLSEKSDILKFAVKNFQTIITATK